MPTLSSFKRQTDPIQVPVSPTPSKFVMPPRFIPAQSESFWVVNPNSFWVRLKGSGSNFQGSGMSGEYAEVVGTDGEGTGWLFPPGFVGVFATQWPRFLSTVSVTKQGLQAGDGFLELAWGIGL